MTNISNILYMHETALIAGAEQSLLTLISNLDKARFSVSVACPSDGPLSDKLAALGAKIYHVDFPKIRKITGVYSAIGKLRAIIKTEDIKLIHSNSIRTNIYAWLAGHPERIPVIWHERNLLENEIFDPDRSLSFLPQAIICNSRAIARRFERYGRIPDKVKIIHNGVDLECFNTSVNGALLREKFGIAPDEIVIGIASRFNKNKGHEIFLAAAAKLLRGNTKERNKLRFMIAGGPVFGEDKDREDALKRLAMREGVSDRVIFTGIVEDMAKIYTAADIMVLTSFLEGCGRVVSEAMACGRPVIGTDTGGTPEMIIDGVTGAIVKAGDVEALTDAMKELIEDKNKRLEMGKESRRRAEKEFDIRIHAKETEDLYMRVINKIK